MRYLLQVYFNGAHERLTQLPQAEREAIAQEYRTFFLRPQVKDGNQLQPPTTATTVRVHDGEVTRSTGPFPTSGEPLGGYYVVEASDIDAAVAIAAHIPAARMGGAIEVRPLVER
jgi:hypothetical protein